VLGTCGLPVAAAPAAGLFVEEVFAGYGGDQAGLKPGDIIERWTRAASPPHNPLLAAGELRSQFDFFELEIEQGARGQVTLSGRRDGEPLTIPMPQQDWVVSVRPMLDGEELEAYRTGRRLVHGPEPEQGFAGWSELAGRFRQRGRSDLASWLFLKLARFATFRASWPTADSAYHLALSAAEGDLVARAQILGFQAESHQDRLEWEAASTGFARALEIHRGRAKDSLHEARVLDQLGGVAFRHGDLVDAELHLRRSLEIRETAAPQSAAVANSLHNLGLVTAARGDLAAAEDSFRRALALNERFAAGSMNVSLTLHNLGSVAEKRGDLAGAQEYHQRALVFWSQYLPGSLAMASGMVNLGNLALKQGRVEEARPLAQGGFEMAEWIVPGGIVSGDAALCLGDIALADDNLEMAETHYQLALRIRQAQQPGSAAEAEALFRLGRLERRRKRPAEAIGGYLRALATLDGQTQTLGGTDEVKARFAALYAPYYHEALDLLMELGRPEEAFHVLERYRSRAFLALLAERDLVYTRDVPEALDRERRVARAEYDRAFAALAGSTGTAADEARQNLEAARRRQGEIAARLRAASPPFADLHYPEPLDLARTRSALDPGTLLLSYAIGEERSHLFAVGPGPDDFSAVPLEATLPKLRDEVARFRQFLQADSPLGNRPLRALAERLSAELLSPVADRIGRAERLLILADGPLFLLPFVALADPTAPGEARYLVEAKPVHTAASATVFAALRRARPRERPARLLAFGDPDYQARDAGAAPLVRSLRDRGLEITPLPGSRREVETLRRLYPAEARVYVGSDAREERARRPEGEPSLLHFACHAMADEVSPLDSSLILSLPSSWKPGEPNGLLQAWEILEQLRIDADLVTLSACRTALGREMSGEGMVGLTRAFHYAGAHCVLASLWEVEDEATAELMGRFYRRLRSGQSKDVALRGAQVEMLGTASFSHPSRWGAFQLSGDWR
jgi:CHAT domain-containing protein/Tfp pilus assembly protein PilF